MDATINSRETRSRRRIPDNQQILRWVICLSAGLQPISSDWWSISSKPSFGQSERVPHPRYFSTSVNECELFEPLSASKLRADIAGLFGLVMI